jgi:hypothetical protein
MTAPITFTTLPRLSGTELADAPAAQARFAPVIDANFNKFNPYLTAFPDKSKVKRVSGTGLLTFAGHWSWYTGVANTNVEGWYYGDIRVISFIGKYSGGKIVCDTYGNLATAYGVAEQPMATITNPAFRVGGGQQLAIAGSTSAGTAGIVMTEAGVLLLTTISEPKGSLDPADWVSFLVAYMVR